MAQCPARLGLLHRRSTRRCGAARCRIAAGGAGIAGAGRADGRSGVGAARCIIDDGIADWRRADVARQVAGRCRGGARLAAPSDQRGQGNFCRSPGAGIGPAASDDRNTGAAVRTHGCGQFDIGCRRGAAAVCDDRRTQAAGRRTAGLPSGSVGRPIRRSDRRGWRRRFGCITSGLLAGIRSLGFRFAGQRASNVQPRHRHGRPRLRRERHGRAERRSGPRYIGKCRTGTVRVRRKRRRWWRIQRIRRRHGRRGSGGNRWFSRDRVDGGRGYGGRKWPRRLGRCRAFRAWHVRRRSGFKRG